jgi:hypothetical protein
MDTINTALDKYSEITKQVVRNKNLKDSPLLKGTRNSEIPVRYKKKNRDYQPDEKIDFSVASQEENTK